MIEMLYGKYIYFPSTTPMFPAGSSVAYQPRRLPFLREIRNQWHRRDSQQHKRSGFHIGSSQSSSRGHYDDYSTKTMEVTQSPTPTDDWTIPQTLYSEGCPEEPMGGVLKVGPLIKSSCLLDPGSNPGPSRQRMFRITSEALDYKQHFSHVSNM